MQDVSKSNNYPVSCIGSTKICQVNSENNKFQSSRNRADYKSCRQISNRIDVPAEGTLIFKIWRSVKSRKCYILMGQTIIIIKTQNASVTCQTNTLRSVTARFSVNWFKYRKVINKVHISISRKVKNKMLVAT